jgi:uncharacterized protein YegL
MEGETEGGENPPDVSPTDQAVVDTAVAAGVATGTAQVAAQEAAEAAADADEARQIAEDVFAFTREMFSELVTQLSILTDRVTELEAERHVSSPSETTAEDAGEGSPPPEETETVEAGGANETVEIHHRRKFRRV